MTGRRGFTLLELLLAVGLMGLMLSLSLPRIGAVKGAFFATEETRNLANAIRSARLAAIEERTTVCLTVAHGDAGRLEERRLPARSWLDIGLGGAAMPARGLTGVWDAPVARSTAVDGRLQFESDPEGLLFFANGTSSGGEILIREPDGHPRHRLVVVPSTGELLVQPCDAS